MGVPVTLFLLGHNRLPTEMRAFESRSLKGAAKDTVKLCAEPTNNTPCGPWVRLKAVLQKDRSQIKETWNEYHFDW